MTNNRLFCFFRGGFIKICISVVLCFSLCYFAFSDDVPADLEAYRAQVLSDCNSLHDIFIAIGTDLNDIYGYAQTLANSSDQATATRAQFILSDVERVRGRVASANSEVLSIGGVAASLVLPASSNALCNCGAQLDTINSTLTSILTDCNWIQENLDNSYYPNDDGSMTWFGAVAQLLYDNYQVWDVDWLQSSGRNTFYPLLALQCLSSISNALCLSTTRTSGFRVPGSIAYRNDSTGKWKNGLNTTPFTTFDSIRSKSLLALLQDYTVTDLAFLASLNFAAQTNEIAVASIARISSGVLSSSSNILDRFSIFSDFVFSADAPLSMYTDKQTDGSYHDYLTNYYIKVSKGQQSGSDSFTNWFSRVELLLAALVFQDEDDSTINTNGVPSKSDKDSVIEVGSSLGQTISGFVQDGNSHVSVVDTSGQSIIRMISSWNTSIGQTAKPAPFVVAEFSAPDSQNRSNVSLWLDTEDERLSSLIEICHGISTLAWVSLFLLLGYNLAVYSIRALRKLISFSFSLYSAIFGGG